MERRSFLGTVGLLTAGTYVSAFANSDKDEKEQPKPKGPVTLYYEFKIAGPEIKKMMANVKSAAKHLDKKPGFLSLSLKMLVGDSTMVHNIPANLKGVLKTAYIDGAHQGTRPFLYTLFIRFESYDKMLTSRAKPWFKKTIEPQLFAYSSPTKKTKLALKYYQGIYKTVSAGDSKGVYLTKTEILHFLKNQRDAASKKYKKIPHDGTQSGVSITVENHVAIYNDDTAAVNTKATALLKVAQRTYQPSIRHKDGISGTLSDSNYQKAVSTEILQNAYVRDGTRSYIFHGVWKSVADHENSHIDPRFRKAAGPVGAHVISEPVEPFYQTMIVHNKV